MTGAAAAIQQ